jgi:hypothetical protein
MCTHEGLACLHRSVRQLKRKAMGAVKLGSGFFSSGGAGKFAFKRDTSFSARDALHLLCRLLTEKTASNETRLSVQETHKICCNAEIVKQIRPLESTGNGTLVLDIPLLYRASTRCNHRHGVRFVFIPGSKRLACDCRLKFPSASASSVTQGIGNILRFAPPVIGKKMGALLGKIIDFFSSTKGNRNLFRLTLEAASSPVTIASTQPVLQDSTPFSNITVNPTCINKHL